jgi:hypothetical protein
MTWRIVIDTKLFVANWREGLSSTIACIAAGCVHYKHSENRRFVVG